MEIVITKELCEGETLTYNNESLVASIDTKEEDQIIKDGYHLYIDGEKKS